MTPMSKSDALKQGLRSRILWVALAMGALALALLLAPTTWN
jgi:hypothetical protein